MANCVIEPGVAATVSSSENALKLIVANAYGLYTTKNKTKVKFLKEYSLTEQASIICVTETHLNPSIRDAEIGMEDHTVYRCDRSEGRPRGGVAIYIKENKSWSVDVLLCHSNSFVETLAVYVKALNLLLITIYRPPECDESKFKNSLQMLSGVIRGVGPPMPEVVIVGDLNCPHLNWETLTIAGAPTLERKQAEMLRQFMEEWCMVQFVDLPTRKNNILDVVITNNKDLVHSINMDKTIHSDHR